MTLYRTDGHAWVVYRQPVDVLLQLECSKIIANWCEFLTLMEPAYLGYSLALPLLHTSEEVYLKRKVEMELGTKMIHLKMRCSGLGSEWGKVTVLGTSGLSGSYVEQRSADGKENEEEPCCKYCVCVLGRNTQRPVNKLMVCLFQLPREALGLKNWMRITIGVEAHMLEDALERLKGFCARHVKKTDRN
ncbi:unnamed protein product [Arabis nemorensis]|uniref:Uncharacterized protein n=1 Tax=Arabis nemorensis TaxID=586526 RepID=A0A565BE80_9BRAS|nr:unnamed protein product [Arabis nemorensis]